MDSCVRQVTLLESSQTLVGSFVRELSATLVTSILDHMLSFAITQVLSTQYLIFLEEKRLNYL